MSREISVIKRAITTDGSVRVVFCDSTAIVRRACGIHNTAKTATAVLGRCLTAASMMGSLLKDEGDSLTLRVDGDGPAGTVVCVSDYKGNVRGYMDEPKVELPPNAAGKLDVGGAVGKGQLYVIRDLGLKEPYVGASPLVSGEIGDDVTNYYAVSEQTPTVCALGVRVGTDNVCFAAGGYLLQLMPGADESVIDVIEKNVGGIKSVSSLIADGVTGEEIIGRLLSGIPFEMFDEFDIGYVCPCARERYLTALASLRQSDLDELVRAGEPVETGCMFCGKKYVFEIDEILAERANGKKEGEENE
ncbi:MAG: Hsp33 family molecular chaperone HslO [Clostridia bacterium]|nr:Hsp33 family molecular chaperone HslO [Clostridia bacterium]